MERTISEKQKVYPHSFGCSCPQSLAKSGFRFSNKNVQKWQKWGWRIEKNLKWVGVASLEKITFLSKKSKQTAEIYFKLHFEGVPGGLESSYFTWLRLFTRRFPWAPFRDRTNVLKFRGRLRSLEVIRGRDQIWHPEARGSHLSAIYGGLWGLRPLGRLKHVQGLGHEWPLPASSGLGPRRPPYMVLKWLPLASGCQIWPWLWIICLGNL